MNVQSQDLEYMNRAIMLAQKGLYSTDPNPRVGCVLVKDNQVIGEGWHQRAGEQHAEIKALTDCNSRLNNATDATCYVTLEPCDHHGKTAPCSEALIEAKVSRVVIAMTDPNPLVSGSGITKLRSAGIEVEVGLLESKAEALNPGFMKRMKTGMPWVVCKLGMSLDAKTAMASGESQWITCEESRQDVQLLRARSSAIITGSSTVKIDNPSMNARIDQFPENVENVSEIQQPWRVIMDTDFTVDPNAKIFSLPGKVIWATSQSEIPNEQNENCLIPRFPKNSAGKVDPEAVLLWLAEKGCNEIMIEAGARLSGAFIDANLVDRLVVYMAPKILGHEARGLLYLPEIKSLAQAKQFTFVDITQVGTDQRITLEKV